MDNKINKLLIAFAYVQQAQVLLHDAEESIYLEQAITENDEAMMAIQHAITKVMNAYAGIKDDVVAANMGENHKPKVTYVDFNRRELR